VASACRLGGWGGGGGGGGPPPTLRVWQCCDVQQLRGMSFCCSVMNVAHICFYDALSVHAKKGKTTPIWWCHCGENCGTDITSLENNAIPRQRMRVKMWQVCYVYVGCNQSMWMTCYVYVGCNQSMWMTWQRVSGCGHSAYMELTTKIRKNLSTQVIVLFDFSDVKPWNPTVCSYIVNYWCLVKQVYHSDRKKWKIK
jgi:hypothetical protein